MGKEPDNQQLGKARKIVLYNWRMSITYRQPENKQQYLQGILVSSSIKNNMQVDISKTMKVHLHEKDWR